MLVVEVHGNAPSGGHVEGVLLEPLRRAHRRDRRLLVRRQRREPVRLLRHDALHDGGPELGLHGGKPEPGNALSLAGCLRAAPVAQIPHEEAPVGAPLLGIHLLGAPPAVLLESVVELGPRLHLLAVVREVRLLHVGVQHHGGVAVPRISRRRIVGGHALGLVHAALHVVVELHVADGLNAVAVRPKPAVRALRAAQPAGNLKPVHDRHEDVGRTAAGRVPQVVDEVEVQVADSLERVGGVALVHEVAARAPTRLDGVRLARAHGVVRAARVGPHVPPFGERELVHAQKLGARVQRGRLHGGHRRLVGVLRVLVRVQGKRRIPAVARVGAVAAGDVVVARHEEQQVNSAERLRGIACLLGRQLRVQAAVAHARVDARGPRQARLLDKPGVHIAHLGRLVQGPFGHARVPVGLPHGLAFHRAPVFERDVEALVAPQRRIGVGRKVGVVGHPAAALELPSGLGDVEMLLALPHAAVLGVVLVGVEVRERVRSVVPHHEVPRIAALHQIGLFEQARLHAQAVGDVALDARPTARLHVLAHQKRRVAPVLHQVVVVKLPIHHNVRPAQGKRLVGAGTQRNVVVGRMAAVAHARVDADEALGALRGLVRGAAAVVVVRLRLVGAPLHVHLRIVAHRHPVCAVLYGERAHHATRALADLHGGMAVAAVIQIADGKAARPHAAGAAIVHQSQVAVLVHRLVKLLHDGLERLIPADAHPARIVLVLGVRALHGVAQAVGVVRGLYGCLRFRTAVAVGVPGAVVALYLHGAAVLHGHPHAALHLAAPAARRADALDLAACGRRVRFRQRPGRHLRRKRGRRARRTRQFDEGAPRHVDACAHPAPLLLSSKRSRSGCAIGARSPPQPTAPSRRFGRYGRSGWRINDHCG